MLQTSDDSAAAPAVTTTRLRGTVAYPKIRSGRVGSEVRGWCQLWEKKSSYRCSPAGRLSTTSRSRARSSTRRILPEMVLGSS